MFTGHVAHIFLILKAKAHQNTLSEVSAVDVIVKLRH